MKKSTIESINKKTERRNKRYKVYTLLRVEYEGELEVYASDWREAKRLAKKCVEKEYEQKIFHHNAYKGVFIDVDEYRVECPFDLKEKKIGVCASKEDWRTYDTTK